MESLKLSFNAVMPIFILMLLGYIIRSIGLCDKKNFDVMNKLVFKIFLPVLLFYNLYKTESKDIFNPELILFTAVAVTVVFMLGYVAVKFLTRDNAKRGVMLQGFFRSNYAILGLPLVSLICGENETGLASLMVAAIVPIFNIIAVVTLECFRPGGHKKSSLIKGIVTNPLIIGCAIGMVFFLTGLKLPGVVEKSISDISKIASPLAIIILGGSFTFTSVKDYIKELSITISVRLIIVPLLTLSAAIAFGFRGEPLAVLLIVFGSPVAVSSFAMAQQMGGDEKLAAQLVVLSSATCLVTLFGWIWLLSYMGWF